MSKGHPIQVGAGATVDFDSSLAISFLCVTTGTITISKRDENGATALLSAFPVTAGGQTDLDMIIGSGKGRIVSSSAVGTLIAA